MVVLQSIEERKPYLKTFHFNTDYWLGNHTTSSARMGIVELAHLCLIRKKGEKKPHPKQKTKHVKKPLLP